MTESKDGDVVSLDVERWAVIDAEWSKVGEVSCKVEDKQK